MLTLPPQASSGFEASSGGSSPALWPATPTPTCSMGLEADLSFGLLMFWSRPEPTPGLAPTFLERRALSRAFAKDSLLGDDVNQPVKVKNTFIDGFADEEEDSDTPPMTACKSWHVGCAHKQAFDDAKPLRRQSAEDSVCETRVSGEDSIQTTLSRSTSDDFSATLASSGMGHVGGSDTAGSDMEVPSPPQTQWPRGPEASRGSALHGSGQCRPCGWFWKPEGCSHGADCCHCHMCPEGELKARKKAKLHQLRSYRSDRRAKTPW